MAAPHPSRNERIVMGALRALMLLFPASFRNMFAGEIRDVVRQQWSERAVSPAAGRRFFLFTAIDLVRQALSLRAVEIYRAVEHSRLGSWVRVLEGWADTWALITSSFIWIAFVATLAYPGFEWGFFGASGTGLEGSFIVLVVLMSLALATPLANAFTRLTIRRGVRLVWLGFLAVQLVRGLLLVGSDTTIRGDTWGLRVSLVWLLVPTITFALATLWRINAPPDEAAATGSTNRGVLSRVAGFLVVLACVPLQLELFAAGLHETYGPRIAILLSVVQWNVLWLIVLRPRDEPLGQRPSAQPSPVHPALP